MKQFERALQSLYQQNLALVKKHSPESSPVFILTSRNHGEGVTTVAITLARLLFDHPQSSVLLVDAFPGQRGAGHKLQLRSMYSNKKKLAVQRAEQGFDYLDISRAKVSGSVATLLDDLRKQYSVVVVDAGCHNSQGAFEWLRYDSYQILVFDPFRSTEAALTRLRQRLESAGISLSGFIMNKRKYPVPRFFYRDGS